jgi:PAS domain S-box-containing protein
VASAPTRSLRSAPPSAVRLLDEVEAVARIGSYALDIASGRWTSSKGCDAIFGIDAGFDRSVESWASLIDPGDRDAMATYFAEDVVSRGQPFDRQYRIVRADTGESRWVHGRGTLNFDPSGRPVRMFGTIADITERRSAEEERATLVTAKQASEFQARILVEHAPDGIMVGDATGRLIDLNLAACKLLGGNREDFLGHTLADIVSADDLNREPPAYDRLEIGRAVLIDRRFRRPDGTVIPVELHVSRLPDGRMQAVVRDQTERQAAEARYRGLLEAAPDAMVVVNGAGEIVLLNLQAEKQFGYQRDELVGQKVTNIIPEGFAERLIADDLRSTEAALAQVMGTGIELVALRKDGSEFPIEMMLSPLAGADGILITAAIRDISVRHRAEAERVRLSAAIEQSADSVIITDADANIEYVNPAFERVSGYAREEVLGQNPRILQSGVHDRVFYDSMWAALSSGNSFVGDVTNRAKDGSLFQEQTVISPVSGPDGKTMSYVAVKHDVTRERAAEASQQRLARERSLVADALARLKPGPMPEATAEAICREVVMLAGITSAMLWRFSIEGPMMPLAFVRADGKEVPLQSLPTGRSEELRQRATGGPWVETWVRRAGHPYDRPLWEMGVRAIGFAPVRYGGDLVGLLTTTSSDEDATARLTESLPALLEFAAGAGVLVGPAIVGLTQAGNVRGRIARIIGEGLFHPVFQAIVDLGSRETVGFEALTRFDSGQRPDLCFAEAQAVDMGPELELATLGAAVAAARKLPAGRWLSLNVSPRLLQQTERLKAVLWPSERPIVLEITEHEIIDDYEALRAAIRALGHDVRIAVDDAGAGSANFSHIVELRPNLVKLDIGLVRDVNSDLARQAMVVGLRHFALEAGCRLLAEGIETEAEADTLLGLKADLGQGYLFGRPEPVEILAAADRRSRADANGS